MAENTTMAVSWKNKEKLHKMASKIKKEVEKNIPSNLLKKKLSDDDALSLVLNQKLEVES